MISRLVWPKVEANSCSVISRPCSRAMSTQLSEVRVVGVDEDAVDVEDHRAGRPGGIGPSRARRARAAHATGRARWRGLSGLTGPV